MSKKTLRCERAFHEDELHAQGLIDASIGAMQRSVANAFLDNVEYGKDYIIRTRITKKPMDYGMKHICTMTFDEIVRCRDCEHARVQPWNAITRTGLWCVEHDIPIDLDGFCAWGERGGA